MEIAWHLEAKKEYQQIPARERAAIRSAEEKLEIDPFVGYPHASNVGEDIRELRPRQGRSPWRAFSARVGDVIVILAIGLEAQQDRRGFERARAMAQERPGGPLKER